MPETSWIALYPIPLFSPNKAGRAFCDSVDIRIFERVLWQCGFRVSPVESAFFCRFRRFWHEIGVLFPRSGLLKLKNRASIYCGRGCQLHSPVPQFSGEVKPAEDGLFGFRSTLKTLKRSNAVRKCWRGGVLGVIF